MAAEKEATSCTVCTNIYNDPRVLFCGHSFCLKCIKGVADNRQQFSCPICRGSVDLRNGNVDQLPKNYVLSEVLLAKDVTQRSMICVEHKKLLSLFCEGCDLTICPGCLSMQHKGHVIEDIDVILSQRKEKLSAFLVTTTQWVSMLQEKKEVVEQSRHSMEKNVDSIKTTVEHTFKKWHDHLHTQQNTIMSYLNQERNKKMQVYDEAERFLKSYMENMKGLETEINKICSKDKVSVVQQYGSIKIRQEEAGRKILLDIKTCFTPPENIKMEMCAPWIDEAIDNIKLIDMAQEKARPRPQKIAEILSENVILSREKGLEALLRCLHKYVTTPTEGTATSFKLPSEIKLDSANSSSYKAAKDISKQFMETKRLAECHAMFCSLRMNRSYEVCSACSSENITGRRMNREMASKNCFLVAAIHFGNSIFDWAWSLRLEYDANPMKITSKIFYNKGMPTFEPPMSVLIKPDGKTFDSIGYEAEDKYLDLSFTKEHKKWYYFRRLNMEQHGKMAFDGNIYLEDETHKTLPAKTVFSVTILYLKNELMRCFNSGCSMLSEDDIMWVLAVPVCWSDACIQIMRESANKAGITDQNLQITLEPEAASMFFRFQPLKKTFKEKTAALYKPFSRYIVLDAGVTVNGTVYEALTDGRLKELHKICCGACGGTLVDDALRQFLISLFGNQVVQRIQYEHKEEYDCTFEEFEIRMINVAPDNEQKVQLRMPICWREIVEDESGKDISTIIKESKYSNELSWRLDILVLYAPLVKRFFSNAIPRIISHVKEMTEGSGVHDISSILMVGKFSESRMLQDAIRSSFPNVKVLIPDEPDKIVLQGAIFIGHNIADLSNGHL